MRFSHQCCCGFKQFGRWYSFVGWVVSDIAMDCSALIFRGQVVVNENEDIAILQNFRTLHLHSVTSQKIWILQINLFIVLKVLISVCCYRNLFRNLILIITENVMVNMCKMCNDNKQKTVILSFPLYIVEAVVCSSSYITENVHESFHLY